MTSQDYNEEQWSLYYNSEGYPYYFNHHNGESVWASTNISRESKSITGTSDYPGSFDKLSSNSSASSNTEPENLDGYSIDNDEKDFNLFLSSPEGQEMLEFEKRIISEKLDKSKKNKFDVDIDVISNGYSSDETSLSSKDSDVKIMSETLLSTTLPYSKIQANERICQSISKLFSSLFSYFTSLIYSETSVFRNLNEAAKRFVYDENFVDVENFEDNRKKQIQ